MSFYFKAWQWQRRPKLKRLDAGRAIKLFCHCSLGSDRLPLTLPGHAKPCHCLLAPAQKKLVAPKRSEVAKKEKEKKNFWGRTSSIKCSVTRRQCAYEFYQLIMWVLFGLKSYQQGVLQLRHWLIQAWFHWLWTIINFNGRGFFVCFKSRRKRTDYNASPATMPGAYHISS